MAEATETADDERTDATAERPAGRAEPPGPARQRGKTVHGEAANAGHRVLAPDDAEVEAYLETALKAPGPGPLARRPARRRATAGTRHRRRPRLRQPVRPADRAPRPRARTSTPSSCRTTRRATEIERRGARAIILSGGPNSVYDAGAPEPDPAIWSGRIPVLGHLLRRAADGPRARRRRHRRRPARVRPGQRHDHRRGRPVRRPRARAAGLDEPRRLDHPAAGRLPARPPRPTRRRSPASPTRARNLYGIQFHPEVVHTPRGRDILRNFVVEHRRRSRRPGRRPTSSTRPSPRSASGSTRTPARPARTGWSSAPCRAGSTRRSRRRSSIARSATG